MEKWCDIAQSVRFMLPAEQRLSFRDVNIGRDRHSGCLASLISQRTHPLLLLDLLYFLVLYVYDYHYS